MWNVLITNKCMFQWPIHWSQIPGIVIAGSGLQYTVTIKHWSPGSEATLMNMNEELSDHLEMIMRVTRVMHLYMVSKHAPNIGYMC